MQTEHANPEPARSEVDRFEGPVVVEFGTSWCGHCRAAQPLIEAAWVDHPQVRRIKVEDGSGLALGRSFGVKLWPTLVFLRDGVETARLVRPQQTALVSEALALVDP